MRSDDGARREGDCTERENPTLNLRVIKIKVRLLI